MKQVLDPASGSRMFYFDKTDPRVVFGDCRIQDRILLCDNRYLEVKTDFVMDFRSLPYDAGSFHLVIFDPPHLLYPGQNSWSRAKYGALGKDWRDVLREGFAECFRVLRPYGVLIFKWNEIDIPVKDILALTPEKPLIGHKSGKASKTHWLTFMKGGE
jgi:SAM-dependent methyltransferase